MIRGTGIRVTAGAAAFAVAATVSMATASASVPSSTSTAAKGPVITLLQQVPIDSSVLSLPGFRTGAVIAATSINAAGGVKGRPIAIQFCDDKLNATFAAKCAQDAVDNGAIARVASTGVGGPQAQPILQNASMADFAPQVGTPSDGTSPIAFPLNPGNYLNKGLAPLAKKAFPSIKTAVIVASSFGGVQTRIDLIAQGAAQSGVTISKVISIPANTPDLSSVLAQVIAAGPDVVFSAFSGGDLVKYWNAAQSQGFTKPMITSATGVTSDVMAAGAPSQVASTRFVETYPSFYGTEPGAAQFRAEFKKYAPGQPINREAWVAWISVKVFADLMNKRLKGAVTRQSVLSTLNGVNCVNSYFYKCLNFTKPGPFLDAPRVTVTNVYLMAPKAGTLVATPYTATLS